MALELKTYGDLKKVINRVSSSKKGDKIISQGKEVLTLLVKAFERRLTFIVGTSVTTGQKDTVVWSGIHHKTSMYGGSFGYPDEKYLNRVTLELADRGVTLESPDEVGKILNNSVGSRTIT
jgi:hypothetical protein